MTKAELFERVSDITGRDKEEVAEIVRVTLEQIKLAVTNGKNVTVRGFGTFLPKKRNETTGRNISKGAIVIVPARVVPFFKPAIEFKKQVIENNQPLDYKDVF